MLDRERRRADGVEVGDELQQLPAALTTSL
jgi:hypothetical protein